MNKSYSIEHEKYLKNMKIKNRFVVFFQIFIIILFLIIWELFAKYEIINTFLISSICWSPLISLSMIRVLS